MVDQDKRAREKELYNQKEKYLDQISKETGITRREGEVVSGGDSNFKRGYVADLLRN
jgi:hypothetical protein